ncbi:hypothetical protein [Pararhodobacter sp. CCB-MM2]|uniref:hypothetical protein n=1 Tax=Pararhodobacter sp. CCB-MM2 TaxID=1786003 RepID=UPI00082E0D69|nr:hypothetical protein [Pararhodobacter sp. CCB-MM2]
MNARASINGITLSAPASVVLARAIGLTPAQSAVSPTVPTERPVPDTLPQGAERALDLVRGHGGPLTRRDFREVLGQTAAQCDALMNGMRILLDHRMVEITAGRGQTNDPYVWALTSRGKAWQPKRTQPITDADILEAVARINARPRSSESRLWWTGTRREYPASASTVCDEILANGRKRNSVSFFRDRLAALAEAGHLDAEPVPRGGGVIDFYWLPLTAPRR